MWTIIELNRKLWLAKNGAATSTQLWDKLIAIQNPEMKAPFMLDAALKQAKRKLGDLQHGPNEAEITTLLKQLKLAIQ